MSDETEKQADEAVETEAQGPRGGERLAEARREQQISVLEIAKELHLDEYKVRALEQNDFETIGAAVFAKGHLKKYSQLVGVDVADVLKDYYELTRSASMPPVVSSRPRPRREMSPGPWIAVIVVIVIVATAYWWLTSRPVVVDVPAPAEEVLPQQQAAPDEEAEQPEDVEPETPPAPEPEADPEPEPAEAAADDGELRLLVSYSGDCWTEITDASGSRLFFDLGKEGRTVELSGTPPFNVLFGNADNVSLQVNGADYSIGAAERRGRTARLTISGN